MTLYFKNNITNHIQAYNVDNLSHLGSALRTDPWEQIEEPKEIALKSLKDERKEHLSKLVAAEMVKPLFCKTVDSDDCYVSTDKTNKFLGYFALNDSASVVRYFRAVSDKGIRLSHDLKLNKTELKELAIHYEQREDQLEEIENKYIDLIDAAKSKTAINNINFEELE